MGLFERFPYTNFHELNAGWMLQVMKNLEAAWEQFTAGNSLSFADPLTYDATKSYAKNTIVLDSTGNAYISLQTVPKGVAPGNQDYWLMVFDYEAFIEKVNKNFTGNYYRDNNRAITPMAVGDWLTLDDVLCKVTAAIAVDDLLEIGVNIEHFTIENFLKSFMYSVNQTILQYKNDIDASELLYRQQLAQDIANTTASLQAQLDAAIAGATVDSEVINARIGADGVTYPTLGDAIRTQVSDLMATDDAVEFFDEVVADGIIGHFLDINMTSGMYMTIQNDTDAAMFVQTRQADRTTVIEQWPNLASGSKYTIRITANAPVLFLYLAGSTGSVKVTYGNFVNNEYITDDLVDVVDNIMAATGLLDEDIILQPSDMIDDINLSYIDGTTTANANWCTSDYIEVSRGVPITYLYGNRGHQCAFYDAQKHYVTGLVLFNTTTPYMKVPNNPNIKYMRWACLKTTKSTAYMAYTNINREVELTIDTSLGLLKGIKRAYAIGAKKVTVLAGTYDIVSEYQAEYGATYFDNYADNYNGNVNGNYDYGLWLDNIEIYFAPGAIVDGTYTGANTYAGDFFSPIAVGSHVKIDGLFLNSVGFRYGIHADFHPDPDNEYLVFKHCNLKHYDTRHGNVHTQAIGGGLGIHSTVIMDDCIFRSTGNYMILRWHNSGNASARSRIFMKHCYIDGDGYASFRYHGPSTYITNALVSDNSWKYPAVVEAEEVSDTNINMQLVAWNNETR